MPRPADPATLERLKSALGPGGWTDDPDELAPHLVEWRNRYRGQTPILLRPARAEAVAAAVKICAEAEVAIVPQGGNTGLMGGQIPHGEVLLSLARMNKDALVVRYKGDEVWRAKAAAYPGKIEDPYRAMRIPETR